LMKFIIDLNDYPILSLRLEKTWKTYWEYISKRKKNSNERM